MELEQCIKERRSIRNFKDIELSKEHIIKLIDAARMAPSWKNSQVSRYYVVSSLDYKEKLLNCLAPFNKESSKNAATLIVGTVVKNRSGFERDGRYTTHIKDGFQYFDHGVQVQNLCLEAYNLGLGTLIMGIYDVDKIRELLNVPLEEEIVSVIAVGYPDSNPPIPPRKEINDITKFY